MIQTTLDGYTKAELKHIVQMYNLDLDISTMKKNKDELKKEMMKAGKKKLVDLPTKEVIKKMMNKKKITKKDVNNQPKITDSIKNYNK